MAGILCETIQEGERIGVVCGIGLNVNMSPELLMQIDRPATSLLAERKETYTVSEILIELKNIFISNLKIFLVEGFDRFFPLFVERLNLKKEKKVRFHDNQTWVEGEFECLHPSGAIELRLPDGKLKTFFAGEFSA